MATSHKTTGIRASESGTACWADPRAAITARTRGPATGIRSCRVLDYRSGRSGWLACSGRHAMGSSSRWSLVLVSECSAGSAFAPSETNRAVDLVVSDRLGARLSVLRRQLLEHGPPVEERHEAVAAVNQRNVVCFDRENVRQLLGSRA
jgi:hypothetical protein